MSIGGINNNYYNPPRTGQPNDMRAGVSEPVKALSPHQIQDLFSDVAALKDLLTGIPPGQIRQLPTETARQAVATLANILPNIKIK